MSGLALSTRTAFLLIRGTPARSAVIGGTIFLPVAVATVASLQAWPALAAFTIGAVGVTAAIVVVGVASAEPTADAGAAAWRAAGAGRWGSGRPQRLAAFLLA
jgi:hypothetical protein